MTRLISVFRLLNAHRAAIKDWIEMGGVLAALAGLVVLIIQTSQVAKQTQAVVDQNAQNHVQDLFEKTLEYDKFTLENPTAVAAVLAPGDSADAKKLQASIRKNPDTEGPKARITAIYIIDFYDYVLLDYPAERFPVLASASEKDEGYLAWSNSIRRAFGPGSHICSVLISEQDTYGTSFVRRLKQDGLCPGLQ